MDAGDLELLRIFIDKTDALAAQIATLQQWTFGTIITVILTFTGGIAMFIRNNVNGRQKA
jgi:hypothetical protein